MNLKKNYIVSIYFIFYLSLLFGFYLNEDTSLGYLIDHFIHLEIINRFDKGFFETLLNFDNQEQNFTTAHSPIFYISYFFLNKIFFSNEDMLRLFNLHISLLIPFIFYKILKLKYKTKNNLIILLPGLFFLSPYFRSGSIWIGSENISMIFLFISFYYYFSFKINGRKNFNLIILNIIFLCLGSYFRPIYSIFSIYFFLALYKDLIKINKIVEYILINSILTLPAFYYIFILEVNFIAIHLDEPINFSRFINQFSIIISILFYYSIPYLLFNYNLIKDIIYNKKNFLIFFIYIITLFLFFNYSLDYGGGIFFRISSKFFESNYIFYFFSAVGLIVFKTIFIDRYGIKKNYDDLILLIVLFFLEIDTTIFHETYDLLFYLIFLVIIKNDFYSNFIKSLNINKISFLYSFSSFFYLISYFKSYF